MGIHEMTAWADEDVYAGLRAMYAAMGECARQGINATRTVELPAELADAAIQAGKHRGFRTHIAPSVTDPKRTILVRVTWIGEGRRVAGPPKSAP
jgi:hypothetical protein